MNKKERLKSTLSVSDGMLPPPSVSKDSVKKLKQRKKKLLSVNEYVNGILEGDRIILSQAITLIESTLPEHNKIAQDIIEKCIPQSGHAMRVGITGVPGAGKSTFIETLGLKLTGKGNKLAILAIDPSSERSKGSILGDKTLMGALSNEPDAFIRPSPSAGTLGGVARKTRETIILCEAAGYNVLFIETVGVGQSETAVHSMVDFFLLLMLAGAGNELQGIKRGIMEMAHTIVITKADGSNIRNAEVAKRDYENALHLYPPMESGWTPKVLLCSSRKNEGIDEIWDTILEYRKLTTKNNFFDRHRRDQSKYWFYETINQDLKDNFYHSGDIQKLLKKYEDEVAKDNISAFTAAKSLLNEYLKD